MKTGIIHPGVAMDEGEEHGTDHGCTGKPHPSYKAWQNEPPEKHLFYEGCPNNEDDDTSHYRGALEGDFLRLIGNLIEPQQ